MRTLGVSFGASFGPSWGSDSVVAPPRRGYRGPWRAIPLEYPATRKRKAPDAVPAAPRDDFPRMLTPGAPARPVSQPAPAPVLAQREPAALPLDDVLAGTFERSVSRETQTEAERRKLALALLLLS